MTLPKTEIVLAMLANYYGKDHVLPMACHFLIHKLNVSCWQIVLKNSKDSENTLKTRYTNRIPYYKYQ